MPLTVFRPCNLSVISTITKNTKISIQTNFFCKGSRAFLTNRIKDKILLTMSTWSQNFCVSHSKLYLWFSKEPIVKGFVCRFFNICQKGYISLIPLFRIILNEFEWIGLNLPHYLLLTFYSILSHNQWLFLPNSDV